MFFSSRITSSFRFGARLYFISTNSFEFLVIRICLHLSGCKVNGHLSPQSIVFSRSCCSSWRSLSDSRTLNIFVSSANRNASDVTMFGRSLMITTNNSGPRTDPWGMPEVTGIQLEHSFPTYTCCVLPVMKLSIHPIMSSVMQCDLSFPTNFYGALCRMLFGSPYRCSLLSDPCPVPLSIYQELSIVVVLLIYPL